MKQGHKEPETRGRGDAEIKRCRIFPVSPFPRFPGAFIALRGGFTLLEILVSLAILGIAITVVLQLFSANLRALSVSDDYVSATAKAEAKMREVLDDDALSEKSWSETTDDGYRFDISVSRAVTERTENLQVVLLEIELTTHWIQGSKEKSLTMRTMKTVMKQV